MAVLPLSGGRLGPRSVAGRGAYGARHKGNGSKKERTVSRIAVDMKIGGVGDEATVGGHPYQMEEHGPPATASQSETMAPV